MKKLLILLAAIGLLNFMGEKTMAQSHLLWMNSHQPKGNLFGFQNARPPGSHRLFLTAQNKQEAQRPTQIKSRMTSVVISSFDTLNSAFVEGDSTRLFWIGTNHQDNLDRLILRSFLFYPGYSFFFTPLNNFIKADSLSGFSWDNNLAVYSPSVIQTSTLDANGNLLTQTSYSYNGTNWDAEQRATYTYDANGKLVSIIQESWDGTVWENEYKDLFSYDANNHLTEVIEMNWDDGSSNWVNSDKYILSYDGQNNLISEIDQEWDDVNNVWNNNIRYSANYTNNVLISEVREEWDSGNSQWEKDTRVNYTYNTSGRNTGLTSQSWDGSAWENMGKYDYTYVGDLVQTLVAMEWVDSISQFVNSAKLNYSYNNYDQCTVAEAFEWNNSQWMHGQYDDRLVFHYETFDDGTGIKSTLAAGDFQLYPNPADQALQIKIAKGMINMVQIVDLSGKVVFQSRQGLNAESVTIPTAQLANGTYYLQIKSGVQQGVKSFVVLH